MRRIVLLTTFAAALIVQARLSAAPDLPDTRLLHSPAVSKDHVAFVYADDLWVCDLDGRNARRLTADPGVEWSPAFSPDGRTVAFTGQYHDFADVYTVPVSGGTPTRLTWHPGQDFVRGWTPDGRAVLFGSRREVFHRFDQQLFTVPVGGGSATRLPIPHGHEASFSPDGTRLAYTPQGDRSNNWKHYRGGTHSRIWVLRLSDGTVEQVPQSVERCNDTDPRWMNDTVYFRSDRHGEFNLFAYDTRAKAVRQLTDFTDFPVMSLNAGGGNVVFEQAGYIHRYDVNTGKSVRLPIHAAGDLPEARVRFAKGQGAKYVRNGHVSPSGARAVFEFRGEIVTVPAEKGDPRNLTNTPAVHERSPAWSPDGRSIAYFSDAGGEYALHVRPADGTDRAKVYNLGGAGFYEDPVWSPDAKKIAYVDHAWTLYWLDLASGKIKKIATEPVFGPAGRRSLRAAWAPDSNWIAYTLGTHSAFRTIHLYSLAEDRSRPVTDGLSDASDPAFDAAGKSLYFLASTDAGPANQWFNLSNRDVRATRRLYVALLRAGTPTPFAKESDEEKPKDDTPAAKGPVAVTIDFDGLDRRLVPAPLPAGDYRDLRPGPAGQVLYLAQPATLPGQSAGTNATLMRFDVAKRKAETLVANVTGYDPTPDGKKAQVYSAPATLAVVELAPGQDVNKGKLNMEAVEVRVDPRAEWRQIFDEAWRINRDYFYAPNYHGADWPAIKAKYEPFLPHLASPNDLYRVVRWMLSELSVGHSFTTPGERSAELKPTPVGLLGADFEVADGRYRFKKVFGGSPWRPELRAPLAAPGVDVKAGEFLLAVRGADLRPPADVHAPFENAADKSVTITVGPNSDGTGARTVTVEPLADDYPLRHLDWVEGNLRKVHAATGGRVAYVYLPDTSGPGHDSFRRYFYAQYDKDAVILDERYNSGGAWADYYLDHLRRPFSSYWAMRQGADFRSPSAAIHGPKVMLINETAGSGGDGLPWMFRQSKLGPLVGKRTWGGEVGTLGFPLLMDGGRVTAPNFALWSPDGGWVVENEGVPPDVEVEHWPAELNAGRDPQLEKAIEIVLKELEKNPPRRPQRPPYPVRVKKPS